MFINFVCFTLCQTISAPDDTSAFEASPFFRRIMDGAEGREPDLGCFDALERVVLTANGNLQKFIRSTPSS